MVENLVKKWSVPEGLGDAKIGPAMADMMDQLVAWFAPKEVALEGAVGKAFGPWNVDRPHRLWPDMPLPEQRGSEEYIEEWAELGRPHEWAEVEAVTVNGVEFRAWLDFGHGQYAMFRDGKVVGTGREVVVTDDCVLLCKDYYGSKYYLWPRTV